MRKREGEIMGGGMEGDRLKQTPPWAGDWCGTQSQGPEITAPAKSKSRMFNWLHHPGAPVDLFVLIV